MHFYSLSGTIKSNLIILEKEVKAVMLTRCNLGLVDNKPWKYDCYTQAFTKSSHNAFGEQKLAESCDCSGLQVILRLIRPKSPTLACINCRSCIR